MRTRKMMILVVAAIAIAILVIGTSGGDAAAPEFA